jgi:hypothetical protein
MSEVELDRYYSSKGVQFVRDHLRVVPVVMLGHVIRTLLPQESAAPARRLGWEYQLPDWIWRIGIFGAATILFIWKPRSGVSWFGLLLIATALTVATTVILFSGEQRYLYPLEVLLVTSVCSSVWNKGKPDRPVPVDNAR